MQWASIQPNINQTVCPCAMCNEIYDSQQISDSVFVAPPSDVVRSFVCSVFALIVRLNRKFLLFIIIYYLSVFHQIICVAPFYRYNLGDLVNLRQKTRQRPSKLREFHFCVAPTNCHTHACT